MKLIRGLHNLRPEHRGCVATIGNFDGVHKGHQAIIRQACRKAEELSLPVVVITFEPQPREYFCPQDAPSRLTRLREKLHALREQAVTQVLCLRFNDYLAGLTAEQFVQTILVEGLGLRHLVVGDDFRFGKGRTGDFELLQQAGKQHNFGVTNTHCVKIDGARVSSTRIREALMSGDLGQVETLLGRPYCICGHVAHGDKRGRTIGFPTANIFLHRHATPVKGVYAVRMAGLAEGPVNGVANIGTRPTVDGNTTLLEVHLFDFDREIYGEHVDVCFVEKLRDEQKFESFGALKQQILRDADKARAILSRQT